MFQLIWHIFGLFWQGNVACFYCNIMLLCFFSGDCCLIISFPSRFVSWMCLDRWAVATRSMIWLLDSAISFWWIVMSVTCGYMKRKIIYIYIHRFGDLVTFKIQTLQLGELHFHQHQWRTWLGDSIPWVIHQTCLGLITCPAYQGTQKWLLPNNIEPQWKDIGDTVDGRNPVPVDR